MRQFVAQISGVAAPAVTWLGSANGTPGAACASLEGAWVSARIRVATQNAAAVSG